MSLTVRIDTQGMEKSVEGLDRVLRELGTPKNLNTQVGRGVANLVRDHLFELNSSAANKNNWPRRNFYSQAAKSVNSSATNDEAVVGIAHRGIRQRYEGGTIRPSGGRKYLAIPARAEAAGRLPSEFSNLAFVKTRRGGMLVVEDENWTSGRAYSGPGRKVKKNAKAASGEGAAMFWLVPSVVQQADYSVLPTPDRISRRVTEVANAAVDRAMRRPGA